MTDQVCVLPHRHEAERPRRAVDGLYTCSGCLYGLTEALECLPRQWDTLGRSLAPQSRTGPQVTGTRERALPINVAVADQREDIRGKLASWSVMIAEERGITPPGAGTPHVTAPWLLVHLRWACAQPWLDEYAAEIRQLRSRANALLYPTGRRRVEVGPCVEHGCDGTLTATIAPLDDLLPSSVTCDVDLAHTWSASEWHTLGRRLHGAAGYDARAAAAFLTSLQTG